MRKDDAKFQWPGTHKTHKRFLIGSTWAKLERKAETSGHGPRTSVLMDINDLEIECLFTKFSLGITLVV